MQFVGVDTKLERMEILELSIHRYYVAVQYHPECISRPTNTSTLLVGLILATKDKLRSFLTRGCKLSPRESDNESGEESLTETSENTKYTVEPIFSIQVFYLPNSLSSISQIPHVKFKVENKYIFYIFIIL